jgi:hypothetical protein
MHRVTHCVKRFDYWSNWDANAYIATVNHADQTVIDLTRIESDEDVAKTVQMPVEEADPESNTTFGPSNRAPSVRWAMVPSNVCLYHYLVFIS